MIFSTPGKGIWPDELTGGAPHEVTNRNNWSCSTADHDRPQDVMHKLLSGGDVPVVTQPNDVIEKLALYLTRIENRLADSQPKKVHRSSPARRLKRSKKKATYYLTKSILARLQKAQEHLLKLTDEKARPKVSKSMIVELALRTAIQDLEDRGRHSIILEKVMELHRKNMEEKKKVRSSVRRDSSRGRVQQ